jgi:transposase
VVDVPAKLSARARVFSTGQGRKTDATDAHSIAVVAARTAALRPLAREDELMALRLLADRREELANARTQAVSRLHRLLLDLIPGGAPRFLSAAQARVLLATVRPREIAGRTAARSQPSCWPRSSPWTASSKTATRRCARRSPPPARP